MPLRGLRVHSIIWTCHGNGVGLSPFWILMLFASFPSQIFVISQSEPRLPLQLEDAVRPDGEGEEVRMNVWMDKRAWTVYFIQDPNYWRSNAISSSKWEVLADTQRLIIFSLFNEMMHCSSLWDIFTEEDWWLRASNDPQCVVSATNKLGNKCGTFLRWILRLSGEKNWQACQLSSSVCSCRLL